MRNNKAAYKGPSHWRETSGPRTATVSTQRETYDQYYSAQLLQVWKCASSDSLTKNQNHEPESLSSARARGYPPVNTPETWWGKPPC